MRHSFAISTAARASWPGYCSSLASSLSKRANASAVAPAKPAITVPPASLRTFLAVPLMTVWPKLTCPSPAIATRPFFLTARIVVPCQSKGSLSAIVNPNFMCCPACMWDKAGLGQAPVDRPAFASEQIPGLLVFYFIQKHPDYEAINISRNSSRT